MATDPIRCPAVTRSDVERFWDERAKENALFFVDSRLDYDEPDQERFWSDGEDDFRRILESVGFSVSPDDTVLDIGCGVGRMTRAVAVRAKHVIGLDVSSEMLSRAREHNAQLENVEWVQGDGETLAPLADGSVDGCFSHVVFQHLPTAEMTLGYVREIGRVLRPGGWALFVLSTDETVHRAPRMQRVVGRMRGKAPVEAHPAWRGSAVDVDALRRTASGAGLTIEQLLRPGTQYTVVLARRADVAA